MSTEGYPLTKHFVSDGVVLEAVHLSPTTVEIRPCQCFQTPPGTSNPSPPRSSPLPVGAV